MLNLDGFVYERIGHFPAAGGDGGGGSALRLWLARLARALRHLAPLLASPLRPAWTALRHRWPGLDRALTALDRRLRAWFGGADEYAAPRLGWLERQDRTKRSFYPQPYRHLAKVLRAHGHIEAARDVAVAQQRATPSSRFVRPFRWLFGACFGYGLKPTNATVTLLVLLAIGWWGVRHAQRHDWMVVTASYSVTGVKEAADFQRLAAAQADNLPRCGKQEILAEFYALDMMLPVVPLHQEDRCELRHDAVTKWWRVGAALFSIIGKIATALALLTYSGVLKPREQDE